MGKGSTTNKSKSKKKSPAHKSLIKSKNSSTKTNVKSSIKEKIVVKTKKKSKSNSQRHKDDIESQLMNLKERNACLQHNHRTNKKPLTDKLVILQPSLLANATRNQELMVQTRLSDTLLLGEGDIKSSSSTIASKTASSLKSTEVTTRNLFSVLDMSDDDEEHYIRLQPSGLNFISNTSSSMNNENQVTNSTLGDDYDDL